MMLIDAEPVEAHRVGVLELVEVVVVKPMPDLGIVQVARDIDPHAAVLVLEVFRQEPVGHQMEPRKFHNSFSFAIVASRAHAGGLPPTSKFVSPPIFLFPSPCKGEDEGEGPCSARNLFPARFKVLTLFCLPPALSCDAARCDSSASSRKCSGLSPVTSRKKLPSPISMNAPFMLAQITAAVFFGPIELAITPPSNARRRIACDIAESSWLRSIARGK